MVEPRGSEPTSSGTDELGSSLRPGAFAHINERGEARIVDITGKVSTSRRAVARCRVALSTEALDTLTIEHEARRVFGEATAVGMMAAKRTARLIPLCHPIRVDDVALTIRVVEGAVEIEAVAEAFERTGLEMEALTACAIAALSIVVAFRKFEPKPMVDDLALWEKSGGRSGHWTRTAHDVAPADG